jgi:hypothetical protein
MLETGMTPKSVEIGSAELLERAAKEAEQSGQSLNELTTEALERELARREFPASEAFHRHPPTRDERCGR